MRLFNKVAIIGVGLIGGSIALAMKKKRLADEIIGVSRHEKTLSSAKEKGAIDTGSQDLNAISDADLVILSAPVGTILDLAPRISEIIRADCIVCDVGSTKEEIVIKLDRIFPNYVGAHPLAGSEKQGVLNSKAEIFEGTLCIVTPTKKTNTQALLKIEKLWRGIGVKVIKLPSDIHDRVVSYISHLSHIVAFSLVSAVPGGYLRFASTGFKDTTRIALSEAQLWSDIFLSNQKNILQAIDSFQGNLSKIRTAIAKKDKEALDRFLKRASGIRKKI